MIRNKCNVIVNNIGIHDISVQYVPKWKWEKTNLTYKFENFDICLLEHEIRESFILACNIWSKHAPISFNENQQGVTDIKIGFYDSSHHVCSYCNANFNDGEHYGHAFFPPVSNKNQEIAGDIHLNKNVSWTTETNTDNDTIDIVTVIAHELGHVLGLDHVGLSDALMNASCLIPHRYLHDDDISGIQNLYGTIRLS